MNEMQKFPVFKTIEETWKKMDGAKATLWAVIGIVFLINLVFAIPYIISNQFWPIRIIGDIVGILLGGGMVYIGLRRVFDLPINYKMVFKGFQWRFAFKYLGTVILIVLFLLIPLLIAYLIDVSLNHGQGVNSIYKLLIALAYIVCYLIAVFLMIRLSLSTQITVAQQVSPLKAIATSFRATEGHFWRLLGLALINFGILIASIVTIGIGFIWSAPYFILIWNMVYKKLIGMSPQEL